MARPGVGWSSGCAGRRGRVGMSSYVIGLVGGLTGTIAALFAAETLRRVRVWWSERDAEWDPY
jgi:hypothetical protein